MAGLMGEGVPQMRELLGLLQSAMEQQGMPQAPAQYGLADMIGAGGGGPQAAGLFQKSFGQAPEAMMGQAPQQAAPQQQMQPQQGAPAMPGQDPMVQKQVALFEMFMKEVADDPYMTEEEKITWANVKVQELMGGLQ